MDEQNPSIPEQTVLSPDHLPPEKPVLISRYLQEGWQLLWDNPGPYIGYTLIVVLVMFVLQNLWGLGQLLSSLVAGPMFAGFYYALRRQMDGLTFTFSEFLAGLNQFVPLMLVGLVTAILVSLGLIVFILPGIYLAVSYLFALILVQDRAMNFWEAMETSRRLVTRQWFAFFGLVLILFAINFVGAIPAGLGLLLTIPLSMAAVACAYRHQIGLQEH